jgi:hypothetical protein
MGTTLTFFLLVAVFGSASLTPSLMPTSHCITASGRSPLKSLYLLKQVRGMDGFGQQGEGISLLPHFVKQINRRRLSRKEKDLATGIMCLRLNG